MPQPADLDLMPAWLPARLDEVLALASDVESLRVGDHVNYFDLRPDNLLIGRGPAAGGTRSYVLDWNWFTLGPAWCDWVGVVRTSTRRDTTSASCSTRHASHGRRTRTQSTSGWP